MTNLNGKQRCEHCFSEMKKNKSICGFCMSSDNSTDSSVLKEGSVLMGKYVVGMFLYKDDLCNYYMGFDMENNSRVSIRELFVDGLMQRSEKGQEIEFTSLEDADKCLFNEKKSDFCKDAQIAVNFKNCKNICMERDLFDENNTSYSVCDFPENGITLRHYIGKYGGRLDEKQILKIMRGVINALEAIHSLDYIHGNLRSENIIIDGANISLMWLHNSEFGHSLHSGPMKIMNAFAPPEQYKKGNYIGACTDIYSLGCVVSYMTSGIYPTDSLTRLMNGTDLQISGVSVKFNEILLKMTELSTNERYEDLDALCVDLTESKVLRLKTNRKSVTNPRKKSHKWLIISVIAALLVCVGALATWYFVFYNDGSNEDDETDAAKLVDSLPGSDSDEEDENEDKDDEKEAEKEDKPDSDSDKKKPDDEPDDEDEPEEKEENGNKGFSSTKWYGNVMKIAENSAKSSAVFGNKKYNKEDILAVEFCDSTDNMTKKNWDISENQDESVMAWVEKFEEGYKLYIGADGGINAKGSLKSCFYGYEKLTKIEFNGALHTEYAEDMSAMFRNCRALKELDLSDFSTVLVSDMSRMFENCENLEKIRFGESFKTTSVTTMAHMFDYCRTLTHINLSGFSTENVTDMSYMFCWCSKLKSLDLSEFFTSRCTDMSYMFKRCSSLKSLNFGRAVVDPDANVSGMFNDCSKLDDLKTESDVIMDAYKKASKK